MNCKLTDARGMTRGSTQWAEGVTHEVAWNGGTPCARGALHFYRDPLLAVMLDSAHGGYLPGGIAWEVEPAGEIRDCGDKGICSRLTTLRRIELPVVTTEQRVRFAILAARAHSANEAWIRWADRWLDGTDRSRAVWSAKVAAWSARAAVRAAREASAAAWAGSVDLVATAHRAVTEES